MKRKPANEIGQRINQLIRDRKLSQEKLGILVGHPKAKAQSRIATLTRKTKWRPPSADEVRLIARALDSTEMYLLYGEAPGDAMQGITLPLLTWNDLKKMKKKQPTARKKQATYWPWPAGQNAYFLPIKDDYLAPHFMQDTIIVIDPDAKIQHGSTIVASLHGGVPQIYEIEITPDRKRYLRDFTPQRKIFSEPTSRFEIYGVVLGEMKRR